MANNLLNETSPYLLQHAYNPVNWYSWNKTALEKAKNENKPIFLSIGYSSCHWCHVMAHESFENNDVANTLNKNFVSIKVDREERPDIDDIYQTICQKITGRGGWPLTVFLTPEQKPFFIGTYFPVFDYNNNFGFYTLILSLAKKWKENQSTIVNTCNNILSTIQNITFTKQNNIDKFILDEAAMTLLNLGDHVNGGFGKLPKFPNTFSLMFLFRYYRLTGLKIFSNFVLKTLIKMSTGGIFDHIGGGFHRYSIDDKWNIPHFEKMLYDNALIPLIYIEAYQITNDTYYLDIAKQTVNYVLRELSSPNGGFYSSQDADSENIEGKYYLWQNNEIKQILQQDYDVFISNYDLINLDKSNDQNILCKKSLSDDIKQNHNVINTVIINCIKKLFNVRLNRKPPNLDDKILTSWNSLMITTLIKLYRVSNDLKFFFAAKKCLNFIKKNLIQNNEFVFHTYKNKIAKIDGYLDDYSYFINALLDFIEIDPNNDDLLLAQNLAHYIISHFYNANNNTFYMTSNTQEELIIRPQNNFDLSVPSGTSVTAYAFLRLFHLTQNTVFYDKYLNILKSHANDAAENPFAYSNLLNIIYIYIKKPLEITVVNTTDNDICNFINTKFLPESISVMIKNNNILNTNKNPFFNGKIFQNFTNVYICKNFTCSLPITTISELKKHLI